MRVTKYITCLFAALLFTSQVSATIIEFDFTGDCDDCAGVLGDGMFEAVGGTLTLNDVTVGENSLIEFNQSSSVVFTYNGSSLLNAFTANVGYAFSDDFTQFSLATNAGQLFADGSIFPGNDEVEGSIFFRFENYTLTNSTQLCTGKGFELLGDISCAQGSGTYLSFFLSAGGSWNVTNFVLGDQFSQNANDIGPNGKLTRQTNPVPSPTSIMLLAIGLLGLTLRRKMA